jgi:dTDP-4-dehydrorhamnose 3,5-epimerase
MNGLFLVEGTVFADQRGSFSETWRQEWFVDLGVGVGWRQENLSVSNRTGTVRGLHWQLPPFAQAKLVRVVTGSILDVVVDIRRRSSTFGRALCVELSGGKNQSLFVPEGFAHGFCTLEDDTIVTYKTSAIYDPACERAMNWSSPQLGVSWPIGDDQAILSEKDKLAPFWADLVQEDLF